MATVTSINATDIKRQRAALERTLQELSGSTNSREELEIEHLADPIDQIRSNTDREIAIQRLDGQARRAREVRFALDRIDCGTYGICEACEEPIGKKRLEVLPWARLCVSCQTREEAEGQSDSMIFDAAA